MKIIPVKIFPDYDNRRNIKKRHIETFIKEKHILKNMNTYVNDELYSEIMSKEFKKKLYPDVREDLLDKIGFNDVLKKMKERIA